MVQKANTWAKNEVGRYLKGQTIQGQVSRGKGFVAAFCPSIRLYSISQQKKATQGFFNSKTQFEYKDTLRKTKGNIRWHQLCPHSHLVQGQIHMLSTAWAAVLINPPGD